MPFTCSVRWGAVGTIVGVGLGVGEGVGVGVGVGVAVGDGVGARVGLGLGVGAPGVGLVKVLANTVGVGLGDAVINGVGGIGAADGGAATDADGTTIATAVGVDRMNDGSVGTGDGDGVGPTLGRDSRTNTVAPTRITSRPASAAVSA